jgi:Arc/MetJ family transcription regulator
VAKTAIDIDRDLADRAAAILGTDTLRATVDHALRDVVERSARAESLERLRNRPFTAEERELAHQAWR